MNTKITVPDSHILAAQYNPTILSQLMQEGNTGADADGTPSITFDPIEIRDLIRQVTANGEHPSQVILGQREVAAYREFLIDEYGEAPARLQDSYIFGLQIIEGQAESQIEVSGAKKHDAWDQKLRPLWQDNENPRPIKKAAA